MTRCISSERTGVVETGWMLTLSLRAAHGAPGVRIVDEPGPATADRRGSAGIVRSERVMFAAWRDRFPSRSRPFASRARRRWAATRSRTGLT
jgi:hypothetical protein